MGIQVENKDNGKGIEALRGERKMENEIEEWLEYDDEIGDNFGVVLLHTREVIEVLCVWK